MPRPPCQPFISSGSSVRQFLPLTPLRHAGIWCPEQRHIRRQAFRSGRRPGTPILDSIWPATATLGRTKHRLGVQFRWLLIRLMPSGLRPGSAELHGKQIPKNSAKGFSTRFLRGTSLAPALPVKQKPLTTFSRHNRQEMSKICPAPTVQGAGSTARFYLGSYAATALSARTEQPLFTPSMILRFLWRMAVTNNQYSTHSRRGSQRSPERSSSLRSSALFASLL